MMASDATRCSVPCGHTRRSADAQASAQAGPRYLRIHLVRLASRSRRLHMACCLAAGHDWSVAELLHVWVTFVSGLYLV